MAAKKPGTKSPNLSVRLDEATKRLLSVVALTKGINEKELAVKAIWAYCSEHLPGVVNEINAVQKELAQIMKKKQ